MEGLTFHTCNQPSPLIHTISPPFLSLMISAKGKGRKGVDKLTFSFESFLRDRDDKDMHIRLSKRRKKGSVICTYWLRGLCQKGEDCKFLHEYDLSKMPICQFWSKYGDCTNGEKCQFRHISPEDERKECEWYNRGNCKWGSQCYHKHVRKKLCENYYLGFCPNGPVCPYGHPKFDRESRYIFSRTCFNLLNLPLQDIMMRKRQRFIFALCRGR